MIDSRPSLQIDSYFSRYAARLSPDWRWNRITHYAKRHPELCAADHFTQIGVYVLVSDERRCVYYGAELADQIRLAMALRRVRLKRLEIEARLLVCECHSDVARLCRLPIGVVEAYSTAFFDVSARSGASAWLASRVVRDSRFADDRLRMVLFQQALRGGPKVVEHWIEHLGFVDQGLVHDLSTPVGRERESLELIVLASRLGQPPTDNLFKASLEEVAANASLPIAVAGKLQAVCEAVLVDQVSDSLLQSVFSDCSDAASSAASMQEPRTADRSVRGHSKNVA